MRKLKMLKKNKKENQKFKLLIKRQNNYKKKNKKKKNKKLKKNQILPK